MKGLKISRIGDLNPQLVIEVQSFDSSGRFVISLANSDNYLTDILHGVPSEFTLGSGKVLFFKYFNYFQSDLTIRVTRESGFANLGYLVCLDNEFEKCIEEAEASDFKNFYLSGA